MPRLTPAPTLALMSPGSSACLATVSIAWFEDERVRGEPHQLDFQFFGQDRGEALRGDDDAVFVGLLRFRSNGAATQTVRVIFNFGLAAFDEDDPLPFPFPAPPDVWSERDEIFMDVRLSPLGDRDRLRARSNTVTGLFGPR